MQIHTRYYTFQPCQMLVLTLLTLLIVLPARAQDQVSIEETQSLTMPELGLDVALGNGQLFTAGESLVRYLLDDSAKASSPVTIPLNGIANAITANDDFLFVGDLGTTMTVFDISDPDDITQLGSAATRGATLDIEAHGDLVFTTTDILAVTDAVEIFDIDDPANPALLSIYRPAAFAADLFIADSGTELLIATEEDLEIVDISDPDDPELLSRMALAGRGAMVTMMGTTVFVGSQHPEDPQTQATPGWFLEAFDVSDPTNPVLLGATGGDDGPIHALIRLGDEYLFASTPEGIQVLSFEAASGAFKQMLENEYTRVGLLPDTAPTAATWTFSDLFTGLPDGFFVIFTNACSELPDPFYGLTGLAAPGPFPRYEVKPMKTMSREMTAYLDPNASGTGLLNDPANPFATVQNGLDAGANTLFLASGTYNGDIVVPDSGDIGLGTWNGLAGDDMEVHVPGSEVTFNGNVSVTGPGSHLNLFAEFTVQGDLTVTNTNHPDTEAAEGIAFLDSTDAGGNTWVEGDVTFVDAGFVGTKLVVDGNVIMENGRFVGDLNVTGDVSLDDQEASSFTGGITFDGFQQQFIFEFEGDGGGPFTLSNLTLDQKAPDGEDGLAFVVMDTLGNEILAVDEQLNLNGGILDLGNNTLMLPISTDTLGLDVMRQVEPGEQSHVKGEVCTFVPAGTPNVGGMPSKDRFAFPVGSLGAYRSAAITFKPETPTITDATICITHFDEKPSGEAGFPLDPTNVAPTSTNHAITESAGFHSLVTSSVDLGPSLIVDLEFLGTGFGDFEDEEDIRLIRRQSGATTNFWSLVGPVDGYNNTTDANGEPVVSAKGVQGGFTSQATLSGTVIQGGFTSEGTLFTFGVAPPPTGTATDEAAAVPAAFELHGNYPNPFNPETTIGFAVPQASRVRLSVYDVLGREVAVLVDEQKAAGFYRVVFDAGDLASGTYFYQLTSNAVQQTRQLVLLK